MVYGRNVPKQSYRDYRRDLYAKWKEIIVAPGQSSISYVLNGGTNHADNPDKYTEGQAAIILKATDGSGVVATCTVTVP